MKSREEILDVFALASGDKYIEFTDIPEIWDIEDLSFQITNDTRDIEYVSVSMAETEEPPKHNEDREIVVSAFIRSDLDIYKYVNVFFIGGSYEELIDLINNWIDIEQRKLSGDY